MEKTKEEPDMEEVYDDDEEEEESEYEWPTHDKNNEELMTDHTAVVGQSRFWDIFAREPQELCQNATGGLLEEYK